MACAVASFHAIQPSSAHLIRAGYFDTPANATASSSTSSSGSTRALGLHQLKECVADRHRLAHRLADHQVGHHRGARLADRAAERVVGDVLDHLLAVDVLQADPQRHLVAAGRVDVVHLGVKGIPQPLVVRVAGSDPG